MTVIAAAFGKIDAKTKGVGWVIGSDSRATLDNGYAIDSGLGVLKLKSFGSFVLGFSGSATLCERAARLDLKRFSLTSDAVAFAMLEKIAKEIKKHMEDDDVFNAIIVSKTLAYYVDSTLVPMRCREKYIVGGCGGEIAAGAMYAYFNGSKPETLKTAHEAVELAVAAAKKHNVYCGGETVIVVPGGKR